MALLDFVRSKLFTQKTKSSGRNILDSRYFGTAGASFNMGSSQDFVDAYHNISYIGFAADKRAGAVAKTPWYICDRDGNEIEGMKVYNLLNRPELQTSFYQFMKSINQHKFLDGNAFILKTIDNMYGSMTGKPTALMVINPANVDIVDETGSRVLATSHQTGRRIVSYNISVRGTQYEVAPDKVIHINNGNAINMLRGMGEIQKNVGVLEADKLQSMFNKAFFEGGAVANLMLEQLPESRLMDEEYMKAVSDFRRTYGRNKEPIMIAPQGFTAKPIDISYKNMEFSVLKSMTKEDIMMFSGIPRSMYGAENQYVNKTEDKIAWEEILDDDYSVIEQEMSRFVQEYEGREDIGFRFLRQNTINIDNALKLVNSGIVNGYVSPSEAREITGLDEDEAASELYYMPFNLSEVGAEAPEPTVKPEEGEKGLRSKRDRLIRKSLNIRQKLEEKALPFVKDYFRGLADRVVGTKSLIDEINWQDEQAEMKKAANRMFTSLLAVGISETNALYGANARTDYGSIKIMVEKLSAKYVNYVYPALEDHMKTIITESMNAGYAQEGIRKALKESLETEYFKGKDTWKATRIARTEAGNAYDQASIASLDELGVQFVDVVGCEDDVTMPGEKYGCNSEHIPIDEAYSINFHPNHVGCLVPEGIQ